MVPSAGVDRKSLLFVNGCLFEQSSGPYHSLKQTAEALQQRGHGVTVVGTKPWRAGLPQDGPAKYKRSGVMDPSPRILPHGLAIGYSNNRRAGMWLACRASGCIPIIWSPTGAFAMIGRS